ncbi:hypothetical protein GW17_00059307 [Ensete ventricosum]|nr:hypothetical protein GW17_00059307 [Ensete ventricosum]
MGAHGVKSGTTRHMSRGVAEGARFMPCRPSRVPPHTSSRLIYTSSSMAMSQRTTQSDRGDSVFPPGSTVCTVGSSQWLIDDGFHDF